MNFQNWGFSDVSVSNEYDSKKYYLFERLGFNTIAINTYIEEIDEEPKKKKRKGEIKEKKDFIPPPIDISHEVKGNLNILQRITIGFSDSSVAIKMNSSDNLKKYDLIAVIPKTLQAFQYACGTLDVDIITFEPEGRIPYKISRKLYRQAVERGIFFELMYAPAIKDSSARKNIISTAHNYHAVGKSRNIILTSSALTPIQTRSVHDVINLGFIFGLNSNESLKAIRTNVRQLILKAQGRKCGKHYMEIEIIDVKENKASFE
ncbi:ribonuclease P protein subunit p30 [Pieris rapae]|uniref:ribonuclease P protein subunit p30 n=1 Tax=Pieris rapae TaxID=64459 RepID=UPI001E27DC14|nr:ribonuclease P protein subunit p30 [Pieris rapae]